MKARSARRRKVALNMVRKKMNSNGKIMHCNGGTFHGGNNRSVALRWYFGGKWQNSSKTHDGQC